MRVKHLNNNRNQARGQNLVIVSVWYFFMSTQQYGKTLYNFYISRTTLVYENLYIPKIVLIIYIYISLLRLIV